MQAQETGAMHELVSIPADGVEVQGMLDIPPDARGLVLFAHGSGSSRHSPRNRQVAEALRDVGIGTLLMDLLTVEEDRDPRLRFEIALLSARLGAAAQWLRAQAHPLPLALFGASTGAAAALRFAGEAGSDIVAVVSRGGRPDLAGNEFLQRVRAPTLLIVGGDDHDVLLLNQKAYAQMHCERRIEIVPGASHLFEEPGRMEEVAMLAANWFLFHFPRPRRGPHA
jgi:putative phosphoribosyl transferase